MGSKRKRARRSKKESSTEDEDSQEKEADEENDFHLWASKGDSRKLKKLLSKSDKKRRKHLLRCTDSYGLTALHNACLHGHSKAVEYLLRYGASTESKDQVGNTPAHLAASHRHLEVLQQLLLSKSPPDADLTNDEGISIQLLVDRALGCAPPPNRSGHSLHGGHGSGGESEDEGTEAWWRRKLQGEASDQEEGVGGWASEEEGPVRGNGSGHSTGRESEDAWADRMWAEMMGRRRAAASASLGAFTSASSKARTEEEAARSAKAEAAARASACALEEEREKDREWRRKAGGGTSRLRLEGPGVGSTALPPDWAAALIAYEAQWQKLEARLQKGAAASGQKDFVPLELENIPWPALSQTPGLAAQTWDVSVLKSILLHGVEGPSEIKRRVRGELLRWHPDKWRSRIGVHLAPEHTRAAEERMHTMSKALTELMGGK